MKWSKTTGKPIDTPSEQLLELPIALCDHTGHPNKGQKSYITKALQTRYKGTTPPVFTNELPPGWRPECCILEGMFLINTNPLGSQSTFGDYGKFLLLRHVASRFRNGSNEVHIIFDNPGKQRNTPKYFEHQRRDTSTTVTADHSCTEFDADKNIMGKWRENVLNCRKCKRNLVKFLGQFILNQISAYLSSHQKCYIAGSFDGDVSDTAWFVHGNSPAQPDPAYTCNAEETDTRLWLHVRKSNAHRILICSPDTDGYHIGLPLHSIQEKQVIVQISARNSRQRQLLNLNHLILAMRNDPDLALIDATTLLQVLQTLFVATGSDYRSFFSGIGKAKFLRYFFQYAPFITGKESTEGTLADIT